MPTGPREIEDQAKRLIALLEDLDALRRDPEGEIAARFGITVELRETVDDGCDIDGCYHPEGRLISVAAATSRGRRRFTIFHELGHALGQSDGDFQDWLFQFGDLGRVEEERVANAFAAEILLPSDLVTACIPDAGPCAWDVVQLAKEAEVASREAVCVRAAQRLPGPGMVTLSRGSVVQFSAAHSLPFRLNRNSDQGPGSFFDRASARGSLRETGVRLLFPSTGTLSSTLSADAQADDSGYVFTVLMEHSAPWLDLHAAQSGPEGEEIDCELCDRTRVTYSRPCRVCGDRPCPDHGCSCQTSPRAAAPPRLCKGCFLQLPIGAGPEQEFCDNCR